MKPKIKIFFTDFWPNFNIYDNYFTQLLSSEFDLVIDSHKPDYIIYSVFGTKFLRYDCVRIFYTGENIRPDFNDCDWAFTFDFNHNERHYRLPLYPMFGDISKLLEPKNPEQILESKTKFCNFIYSNAGPRVRRDFFFALSKYKKVDSAGRLFNNIERPIENKLDFIADYKFTIAFENDSFPGYTTEKIFEPMLVNSIPIYYGNPKIAEDFNPKSFVNYHEYGSQKAVIERVVEIDSNKNLYLDILAEPYFIGNKFNKYIDKHNIINQFKKIFTSPIEPLAKKMISRINENKYNNYVLHRDYQFKLNALKNKILNFNIHKVKVKWLKMQENRKKRQ